MYKNLLTDYLPDFFGALKEQLESDEKRWGDTWKQYERDGQEDRIFLDYKNYYYQYKNAGVPIPWLKVAGNALIAWVRELENKS